MLHLRSRRRSKAATECADGNAPAVGRPVLSACRDAYFADATVRCELPTGHEGAHQAHLPRRRRIQWSVLDPVRAAV